MRQLIRRGVHVAISTRKQQGQNPASVMRTDLFAAAGYVLSTMETYPLKPEQLKVLKANADAEFRDTRSLVGQSEGTSFWYVSDYYAGLAPSSRPASETPEWAAAIARGREIAERGIPAQRTPSCRDCHGPGPERKNSAYPALAGQYAEYLVLQLELFKSRERGGSSHAHLMMRVATTLSSEQMRDVARYYAAQLPAAP